jgi:hypothetical protein
MGPPYAGGIGPRYALCWDKGDDPVIDVDLQENKTCGAFQIHLSGNVDILVNGRYFLKILHGLDGVLRGGALGSCMGEP